MTKQEWLRLHPDGALKTSATDPDNIYASYVRFCRSTGQEPLTQREYERGKEK